MSSTPKLTISPGTSSPCIERKDEGKIGYILANGCRYEIEVGDTRIGRDPSVCSIILDDATVSKLHAVVESAGPEDSFIYDSDSTNKTRIGKMVLKPNCRYKINDNDKIILGNTTITYLIINEESEKFKLVSQSSDISEIGEINFVTNDNLDIRTNVDHNTSDEKITGTCSPTQTLNEIFQTPPAPLLKEPVEKDKRNYYITVGDKSPDPDIFSLETQCEVSNVGCSNVRTESKNFDDKQSRESSSKVANTCQFLGPKLKCEVKNKFETPKPWKSQGGINCKVEYANTSLACESFDEDIFDLPTQCPLEPGKDVESSAKVPVPNLVTLSCIESGKLHTMQDPNAEDSLKVKNINSKEKLTEGSCVTTWSGQVGEKIVEESQSSFLNDGEDDKLVELMKITSPSTSFTAKSPLSDGKQRMGTESLKCDETNNMTDDIFDLETQVAFETTDFEKLSVTNRLDTPNEVQDIVAAGSSAAVVPEKETDHEVFKAPTDIVQSGHHRFEDEDMIMTQIFDPSDNHKKNETGNISQKNMTSNCHKNSSPFEGNSRLEDGIITQVYIENECFGDNNDLPDTQAFQDDIPTQMYHDAVQTENNCELRLGVENSVQEQQVDSGDETDSDLETKLYSIEKDRNTKFEATTKIILESPRETKKGQMDPCSSTLDCIVSGHSDIDGDEDFIETQMFPSEKKILMNNSSMVNLHLKQISSHIVEDDILTQVFTQGDKHGRSDSESSDKTDSDIVEITSSIMSRTGTLNTTYKNDDEVNIIDENSNQSVSSNREMSPLLMDKDNIVDLVEPETSAQAISEPPDSSTDVGQRQISDGIDDNEDGNRSDSLMREMSPLVMTGADSATEWKNVLNNEEITLRGKTGVECVAENVTPDITVLSDSDETDCEGTLNKELRRRVQHSVQALVSEVGVTPSTSAEEAPKARKRSSRAQSNPITSYFKIKDGSNTKDPSVSPLKRTRRTLSTRTASVKKSRPGSDIEIEPHEEMQNRTLRSRAVRGTIEGEVGKKMERRTPAKERLISEIDLENIIWESDSHKSLRPGKCAKMSRKKTDLPSFEETVVRRSLRARRIGEESRGSGVEEKRKWQIAFTGIESRVHDSIISSLDGKKVDDLNESHVLVTDRVRRTVKFLSAIALGIPVVSPKWLTLSEAGSKFQNPWDYLLDDKASEKRWGFNLRATLEKWRNQKLLKGYSVFATESTKPPVKDILNIVRCCGGTPLTTRPDIWPDKSIVLTCIEDKKSWPMHKHRHVKIVHYEFLLSGVLSYSLDFKTFKLR